MRMLGGEIRGCRQRLILLPFCAIPGIFRNVSSLPPRRLRSHAPARFHRRVAVTSMAFSVLISCTALAVPIDASWDLSSVAGEPVTFDPSGHVSFDGVGNAGRAYLRTHRTDFHNTSFVAEITATRWLSVLPGSTRLSRLSIPGTHNSAARVEPFPGTAKCQDLTIADQLAAGIRYFDIRCRHIDNVFAIHHGSVFQNLFFGEVLAPIYAFLAANPGECVMMAVEEEHTPSGNTRTFAETFQSYVAANPSRWWLGTSVPTLAEARGKIVLVRRFGGYSGGINATNWPDNTAFLVNNLAVEDQYVVPDNNVKWDRILTAFGNALAQTNANILHLTHTSGYRPGFLGIPSITTVSNNINPRLQTYFTGRPAGNHGCVIMDFANAHRSRLILNTNFPAQGPVTDGIYQLRAVHSGKALEIEGASTAPGAPAVQRTWTGGNHQRFVITNLGDADSRQ